MSWTKVPGYNLEVQKNGKKIRDSITGKLKNQHTSGGDYKYIDIRIKRGLWKTKFVHTLVARTFIGRLPKGKEVNHKDLIPWHNHYKNLEYMTRSENLLHASKNGRMLGNNGKSKGANSVNAKLTWKQVKEIRKLYGTLLYYNSELAKIFKVTESTIWSIVNNKTWCK